jgi:hypothetical protein
LSDLRTRICIKHAHLHQGMLVAQTAKKLFG